MIGKATARQEVEDSCLGKTCSDLARALPRNTTYRRSLPRLRILFFVSTVIHGQADMNHFFGLDTSFAVSEKFERCTSHGSNTGP